MTQMDQKPLRLNSYNLHEITKQLIEHLTTTEKLDRKGVAAALGVSERTLYRYFNKMNIQREAPIIVPHEVKQKVKVLGKSFPNMKKADISSVLMQYYKTEEQTVMGWLDVLNVRD